MRTLSAQEVASLLGALPEWRIEKGELTRTFTFKDFLAALAFVNRVGERAEAVGHHPDIDIRYNKVRLGLVTHDAGGLTTKDFDLAAIVNRLAWDVSVPRDTVGVKVEDGWITLSGKVDWHFQREAAVQDVRRLLGVTGVTNQITLRAAINVLKVRGDLMHALDRSWSDSRNITVTANGATVKLTGTVRTPHDRDLAVAIAWSAPGASAVENDLTISL